MAMTAFASCGVIISCADLGCGQQRQLTRKKLSLYGTLGRGRVARRVAVGVCEQDGFASYIVG